MKPSPTRAITAALGFAFSACLATAQTVSVSISATTRPLHPNAYGYNNNEAFTPSWTATATQSAVADTYANILRYPGGTTANYFNWETGQGYVPTNKAAWTLPAARNTYTGANEGAAPAGFVGPEGANNPSAYSTGSGTNGNPLSAFLAGLQAINTTRLARGLTPVRPTYVVNLGTSADYCVPDLEHQLDALQAFKDAGQFPEFLEMGNELFIDAAFPDYTDQFPTAEDYADRVKEFILAVRQRFPGQAFKWGIPVVKNVTPVNNTTGDRSSAWARKTLNRLAQSPSPLLPHAVIFHYYTTSTNDASPAAVYGSAFNAYSNANWLNFFPRPDSSHLNGTANVEGDGRTEQDIAIWITEWGMSGQSSNPAGDQWFYALHHAAMGLLQLRSPRFEMATCHVIFAGSSWSHLQTTSPYSKQNLGWGTYALNRATAAKTEARELSFSPNSTNGSGSTAYPTLYGWEFSRSGGDDRQQLILNFSDSAQTVSTSGLGNARYEILARDPLAVVNGTDAAFASAGGQTFGNLGSTLVLPPHSITRLYTDLTPRQLWRFQKFGTVSALGTSADLADPDADGTANLLEYGLALAPLTPEQAGGPVITIDPVTQRLRIAYTRVTTASDVIYTVQASDDLVTWETLAFGSGDATPSGTAFSISETGSGPTRTVTVTDRFTLAEKPRRFLRIRISQL